MGSYRMTTIWRLEAPRADVWAALRDPPRYPDWWPGITEVVVLEPGAEDGTGQRVRVTTRSTLPYDLRFEIRARVIREPDLIVVDALGELAGTGRWELRQDGDLTTAAYTWEVSTSKTWMNLLEPFARPAFIWNHHVVMGWGGEGLARHLDAPLAGLEHTPPVRARDWSPLVALALALVFLRAFRRRARSDRTLAGRAGVGGAHR
jgi:uncharacterized protein YndB with AHSA1/START domain